MLTTKELFADLIGTFGFALSGATAATRQRLDLFGVLVLSFAAANSGGIAIKSQNPLTLPSPQTMKLFGERGKS